MIECRFLKLLVFSFLVTNSIFSQKITSTIENKANELVSKMTLDEKIDYISGYKGFYIRPIERLGLPQIRMADGPQGIRNETKSTLYPCGILSASTWNRKLMYELGEGIGRDARARGVHILLGPGVNIYRAPMCGRNFEYFGEDPYLTSEVAVNYIKGVQSKNVIATIKHFAANNQEWNRHHVSSDVDERTLLEIYFPAFRKAVIEANVGAVMCSYNPLNGVHASENKWLNIDVLRNQWGFKGLLMSDWDSMYSTAAGVDGGVDLEMPSGKFLNRKSIKPLLERGIIDEKTIDLKVKHIIQTLLAFDMIDGVQKDSTIALDNEDSKMTALKIAREGVVLLKNQKNVLPLNGKTLVVGPNAGHAPIGGGSGAVTPYSYVSVGKGMKDILGKKCVVMEMLQNKDRMYESIEEAIGRVDNVVICMGFDKHIEGEFFDRKFTLPMEQVEMVNRIAKYGKNVVVVLNSGGGVDFSGWADNADGILMAWYPGQEGGKAVAEILTGKISPSGKLPISIEKRWEDNPVYNSYYDNRNIPHKRVQYSEGIFVGYRGYDYNGVAPLYPFGFGLSYSKFKYDGLDVEKISSDKVRVKFSIENIGKYDASEVAQIYVRDCKSSVPRPLKELKGYEKVFLKKGEMRNVSVILDKEAFSFYDVKSKSFVVEPGEFEIMVGGSSAELPLKQTVAM